MNGSRQDPLAAAAALIEQNDPDAAANLLSPFVAAQPSHPVALYLLGVTEFEKKRWAAAESLFRRALVLAPGQPQPCLHLAQALRAQQRPAEALDYCRQVLAQAPDHDGAWLELAKAQEESGRHAEAQASYHRILGRGPNAIADANLAALQKRLAREQRLAEANMFQHLGRLEKAASLYETLLAEDPLDIDVHVQLAEIRHRLDQDEFAAFDAALALRPEAAQIPSAKGRLLLKLQRPAEAERAFRAALHAAPGDAGARGGLGRALEALGDGERADAEYARAIAAAPDDGDVLEDYAGFLLRRNDARQATQLAEKAARLRPASQGALALLGLGWRALGDARAEWLNDYQRHVRIYDLEPPDGFSDMDSFNRELSDYLGGLHNKAQEYFTQTLRGGTQTHGDMFYHGHDLIDRLLPRINRAIQDYAAQWKDDAAHPFTARRGKGFRYAGSWSSRLSDCGFHVNHIHARGWISSCYYVALPDAVSGSDQQGWIKFGEPSADFGAAFTPQRAVQPKPGRLVLFPSYMWHGTVAFRSPQNRTTIAFDAVPA